MLSVHCHIGGSAKPAADSATRFSVCATTLQRSRARQPRVGMNPVDCDECGKASSETKRCSVCKTARYCSVACQRSAWSAHKKVCKPHVYTTNARLTDEHGMALDETLMLARFLYNRDYAPPEMAIPTQSIEEFHAIPRGDARLHVLNSKMYSVWTTDHHAVPGVGLYRKLAQSMQDTDLYPAVRKYARHFDKVGVSGSFYVMEQTPEGTILVDSITRKVYSALGMGSSIFEVISSAPDPRPVRCGIRLLPWQGHIVYDGIVVAGSNWNASPTKVLTKMLPREEAASVYAAAKSAGKIIKKIKVPKDDGVDNDRRPIDGSGQGSASSGGSDAASVVLSSKEQKVADDILKACRGKKPDKDLLLVFRRYGHTPEENPHNQVVAMWMSVRGGGMAQAPDMFTTKRFLPTAVELLDVLRAHVRRGRRIPSMMQTDHLDIVPRMNKALEGTGAKVMYYPPPSAEEKSLHNSW